MLSHMWSRMLCWTVKTHTFVLVFFRVNQKIQISIQVSFSRSQIVWPAQTVRPCVFLWKILRKSLNILKYTHKYKCHQNANLRPATRQWQSPRNFIWPKIVFLRKKFSLKKYLNLRYFRRRVTALKTCSNI